MTHLNVDKKYYLVLDGLDECDSGEVQQVARGVAQICRKRARGFKILCTGRLGLERELFGVIRPKYNISVTESKVELDMDHYIDSGSLPRRGAVEARGSEAHHENLQRPSRWIQWNVSPKRDQVELCNSVLLML